MRKKIVTVNDLPETNDIFFVCDSQDVQAIKEYVGKKSLPYDSFFAKIQEGDYVLLYGMIGIIPWIYKPVYKII